MKIILFFLSLLVGFSLRAAVPSFGDFLTNYFTTTGNKVGLRTNLVFTNAVFNSITFTNGTNSQTFFFPGTNLLSGQLLTVLQLSSNQFEIHGTNVMAPSVVVDTIEELEATEIPAPGISLIGFVRDSRGGFFVYQPLSIKPVDNFRVFATTGPGRWERTDDPNIIRPEWGKVTGGNVTNETLVAALVMQGAQGYGRVVVSGTDEFLYSDDVPLAENSVLFFEDGAQATGLTISGNGITNAAVIGAYHIAAVASPATGAYYLTNSTVILAGSKFLGYTGSTINQSGTTRLHVIDSKGRPFTAQAFGAVGDDVADDTVALTTGALISGLQNQPLRLDGTYKISSMITITNAVTMLGTDGQGKIRMSVTNSPILRVTASDVTIKGLTLTGPQYLSQSEQEVAIDVQGTSEASPIRNFKSIGNTITNLGFYGIYMTFVKDFEIQDNKINHINYAGVMGLSVSNGVICFNEVFNVISNPNSYGIALGRVEVDSLTTNPRSSDVRVSQNFLHSMQNWTALDTHGGQRIAFVDNVIYGAKIGIGVGAADGAGQVTMYAPLDCVIENNIVISGKTDGTAWYGLIFHGALGTPGAPVQKATGKISGNLVRGYGDQSNATSGSAIYTYATEGLVITDNAIFDPSPIGIMLYSENYGTTVSGNTITDPWTDDVGVGAASAVSMVSDYNKALIGGNSFVRGVRTNTYVLNRGVNISALTNNTATIGPNFNQATLPLNDDSGNAALIPHAPIRMMGQPFEGAAISGRTLDIGTNNIFNVDINGNVGIGITVQVPTKRLHVYEGSAAVSAYQVVIQGADAGYGAGLSFWSVLAGGTNKEMARITADGEDAWNTTAGTQDAGLRFFVTTNGVTSERMKLGASGNLGIGNSEPGYPLSVGGIIESTNGGYRFPDGTTQITAAGGGLAYDTIEDEGSAVTARRIFNFIGAGVTALDNAGALRTDITISGGGSSDNWSASGTTNSTLPGVASADGVVITNSATLPQKLSLGLGGTNILAVGSGRDLVYTNGAAQVLLTVINGNGDSISLTANNGGAGNISTSQGVLSVQDLLGAGHYTPLTTSIYDLGSASSWWDDINQSGSHRIFRGNSVDNQILRFYSSVTNIFNIVPETTGSANGNVSLNLQSLGTGTVQANGTQISVVGHAHAGEDVTSGTVADARIASTLTRDTEIDTSSELASLVTDETGSGALVFANSPTFTGTINLGMLQFPADAGGPFIDISVTATTTAATVIGYTNRVDGNDVLLQSGVSDGAGSVTGLKVQIPNGVNFSALGNTNYTVYAAGTAYALTGTAALLDFGTTDPSVTILQAGTYLIHANVGIKYNAATYVAAQTATVKLRRTNNTAADLTSGSRAVTMPVLTTFTGGDTFALPPVIYTTANANDIIQIFGILSATPSAGSVDADSAEIVVVRLY